MFTIAFAPLEPLCCCDRGRLLKFGAVLAGAVLVEHHFAEQPNPGFGSIFGAVVRAPYRVLGQLPEHETRRRRPHASEAPTVRLPRVDVRPRGHAGTPSDVYHLSQELDVSFQEAKRILSLSPAEQRRAMVARIAARGKRAAARKNPQRRAA